MLRSPGRATGRGLKLKMDAKMVISGIGSPGRATGRGLKPVDLAPVLEPGYGSPGRATGRGLKHYPYDYSLEVGEFARSSDRAWIETRGGAAGNAPIAVFARSSDRAWIETVVMALFPRRDDGSPGRATGRGLKPLKHSSGEWRYPVRPVERPGVD